MIRLLGAARRAQRVTGAFMWLGVTESMAYPLMVLLNYVIGPTTHPVMYLFVSRLFDDAPKFGNDYYTFVIIGLITTNGLNGGLTAFSRQLDSAIQQGSFETFLVQPISWFTLPFALAAWPIIQSLTIALVMGVLGVILGAKIEYAHLPEALVVLALGIAACHAIGTLAAAVRLLSKRADPVVAVYSLLATVFAGTLFPVSILPALLRPISYALPHTYVMSAMRRVLMPDGDLIAGPSFGWSVAILVATTIVLYAACLYAYGRSLDFGRRYGVLGGY